MPLVYFYTGRTHEIVTFQKRRGRDEVRTYLDGMQKAERSIMVALLHSAGDEGPPFNRPDRCRPIKGEGFNEFKTHGHRILWMIVANRIVLMTAFEKKQPKTPETEVIRGRNARTAILSEVNSERNGR